MKDVSVNRRGTNELIISNINIGYENNYNLTQFRRKNFFENVHSVGNDSSDLRSSVKP